MGIPVNQALGRRRSAVRNPERAGISRSVVMELTGHNTDELNVSWARSGMLPGLRYWDWHLERNRFAVEGGEPIPRELKGVIRDTSRSQ